MSKPVSLAVALQLITLRSLRLARVSLFERLQEASNGGPGLTEREAYLIGHWSGLIGPDGQPTQDTLDALRTSGALVEGDVTIAADVVAAAVVEVC